jgi:hypothetical protein
MTNNDNKVDQLFNIGDIICGPRYTISASVYYSFAIVEKITKSGKYRIRHLHQINLNTSHFDQESKSQVRPDISQSYDGTTLIKPDGSTSNSTFSINYIKYDDNMILYNIYDTGR